MSAYKRFGGNGIGTRQLRELYDKLAQIENEIIDLSNQEIDVSTFDANRIIYKDSDTLDLTTSNTFYYDGSFIGFNTIPEIGIDFDISGVTFFRGDIHIDGSLSVFGTTTTINTNEFDVSTNYININEGMQGVPPITLKSGIRVNRGTEPDYMFEFSELHDLFRVGITGGDMNPVTERELIFQDRTIPIWDATSSYQGRLTYNSGFVMDESGNLGIGTASPNGDKVVIQDNDPTLVLYDSSSGTINLEFIRGNRVFGSDSFTDWRLRSHASLLRIDGEFDSTPSNDVVVFSTVNGGRMGIQVIPTAELDVNGQTYLRDIVGIRTVANPSYSLTVSGDVLMSGDTTVDIYFPTDASGINARVRDISQNLSDLSGVVDINTQTISDVSQNLSDLSGVVDINTQTISDVSQNLSDLSGVVDINTQTISDVSQNLSDLSGVVDINTQTISDVSQNLSDLSGVVSENKTKITYQASSGVYEGGIVSLASSTTINISGGKGLISDNSGVTIVEWADISNYTIPNISTTDFTQVYIDTSGNVYLENSSPTPITRRQYIYLAKLVHEGSSLFIAFTQPQAIKNGVNGLHDYFENISNFIVLSGAVISANNDLHLDFTEANLYGIGINFANESLNPNIKNIPSKSNFVFRYRLLDNTETVDTSFVDPDNYESSPGTLTAVPSNNYTNQHIYLFPSGIIRIQYGQQPYNKLVDAVDSIPTEPFILEDNIEDNGVLIAVLTVKEGTTSLSSSTDAIFTQADQFGRIGTGGGIGGGTGITDLQTAYTFEDDGYIELDGVKPFGVKDQSDNTVFSVNNDSTITMNATIDFSCNSLEDISRITFCPSGTIIEESEFFDICSTKFVRIRNVTVDTTSGRLGVGTTTPQRTVHFAHESSSTLLALENTEDPSANGNNVVISFRTPMNGNTFYESGAIQHRHVDLSSSQVQLYTTDDLSLNPVVTAKRQYVGINVEDPSYILHVKRVVGKNPNLLLEGDSVSTGAPKLTFQDVSGETTYTIQQTNNAFQLFNDNLAEPILQTWDTSAGDLYGRLCLFDQKPTYDTVLGVTGGKGQFSSGLGLWSSSSSRASQSIYLFGQTNPNNASRITFHKNNGPDYATAGDLSNTDILYYIWSYPQVDPSGSASVNYVQSSAIIARMDNDVSNNRAPTALTFSTMSQTENNTERARITSVGNVGIGTTTPVSTLGVNGRTVITLGNNFNTSITARGFSAFSDVSLASLVEGSNFGGILEGGQNGHLVLGIRANDVNDSFYIVGAPLFTPSSGEYVDDYCYNRVLFRVKSDGNVGVGATTPNNKLEIIGSTTVPDITDAGYAIAANTDRYGMILEVSGNTTDSAAMWIKNDTPGASPSTLFRLNNNGNVGIGTNTPVSLIGSTVQVKDGAIISGDTNTVAGSVALYPYYQDDNYTCCYGARHSSGGAFIGYGVRSQSTNITSIDTLSLSRTYLHVSTDLEWWTGTSGAYPHGTTIPNMTRKFYVDNAGSIYATSGTVNVISENKKKTDIQPIQRPINTIETEEDLELYREQSKQFMNKVDALQGVKYGLTTQQSSMKTIGLKAKQVEESFPSLIKKVDDGSMIGKKNEMSLVDYNGMIGVLLETIKGLKEEVNDLKNLLKSNDGNTTFHIPKQTTYSIDGSLNMFDDTPLKELFSNNNFIIYMIDSVVDEDENIYVLGLAYFTTPIRKNQNINSTQKALSFIVKYTSDNQLDTSFGVDVSGVSLINNISNATEDDGTRPDLYLDEFIIGRRILLHENTLYVTGRYAFRRFRYDNTENKYNSNFVSAFMLLVKYSKEGVIDTSFRSNQSDVLDGSQYGYFLYEQFRSGYYIINLFFYYQEYLVDLVIHNNTLYACGYAIRDYNNDDNTDPNYNSVDLYEGILLKLVMTEQGYKRPFLYRYSYTNETFGYRIFYDLSNTLFMTGTTFNDTGIYDNYVTKINPNNLVDQSDMTSTKPLPTFINENVRINTVQDTDYTIDGVKATAIRCVLRTALFHQTAKQLVIAGDETWYDASSNEHNTVYLSRINSDLSIDTTFGTNGFTRIEITPNKYTNQYSRNEGIQSQSLNLERRSFHTLVEVDNGYLLVPTYKAVLTLEYSLRRPISEGVLMSITQDGKLNTQFGEYKYVDGTIQTNNGVYVQKGYKTFHSAFDTRSPLNTREYITSIKTDLSNVVITGWQEIPQGLAYFLTSDLTNDTGAYTYNQPVTIRENTEQFYEFNSLDSNQRVLLCGEFQWIDPETGYLRMNIFLERRLSDSNMDTTFGTDGRIILNIRDYPLQRVYAIREDPYDENYVLISGYVGNQSNAETYTSLYLARVNVNGTLDASFGESNGYTITCIDMKSSDFVWNMITDLSGNHKQHNEYRILLSGYTSLQPDIDDDYKAFVLCYTQNGFIDTTFQGKNVSPGLAVPRIDLSTDIEEYAYNIMTQIGETNRYILGGDSVEYYDDNDESNIHFNVVVYGYKMNGELDVSFGGQNDPSGTSIVRMATTTTDNVNEMFSMNQDSSNRIILVGHIDFQCAIVCLTKDGELDTTFGIGGKNIFSFQKDGANLQTVIFTSAIDVQDRIYVAGYTVGSLRDNENNDEGGDDIETTIFNDLILARFTNNGVLDTTFGENGTGYRIEQTSNIDQIYYSTIDTVNQKLHLCGYTEINKQASGIYKKLKKREINTFNI